MSNGEPQTPFEGYIKGKIEDLGREMREVKASIDSVERKVENMANQAALTKGKMIGWGSAFGVMGGVGAAIVKALWR